MCGEPVSPAADTCPACGERLGSDEDLSDVGPKAVRRYLFQLKLLSIMWTAWGLFSGWMGVNWIDIPEESKVLLLTRILATPVWCAIGIMASQKKIRAVYSGHVISYVSLLIYLVYLRPIGIILSIGFILFSRTVLKRYRQLKEVYGPTHLK